MELKTIIHDNILIVRCSGKMDALSVVEFKKTVGGMVEAGKKHVILDLSGIDFLDSSGLGSMVSLLKLVRSKGGDIKLCGPNGMVRSVLELTRFHLLFDILDNCQQAVAKMTEGVAG
ncbi:MAG: STAS domain-containing protein [Calditrichota bacterium]|mgnify:CR=1 FL=1